MNELIKTCVDLIKEVLKTAIERPSVILRFIFNVYRLCVLISISVLLYKFWISDFTLVTSVTGIYDFFLSGRFIKPVLIFLLTLVCFEVVLGLLVSKLFGWIAVNKMLAAAKEIKREGMSLAEAKRRALKRLFRRSLHKGLERVMKFMSEDYEPDEVNNALEKPTKIDETRLDLIFLTILQTYIFACMIGHHSFLADAIILLLLLPLFALLKGLTLIGKAFSKIISV